jgi:dTMP kinase
MGGAFRFFSLTHTEAYLILPSSQSKFLFKINFLSIMFITFEGIEGCGKTTQIHKLRKVLKNRKIPCLVTREPGATRIGLQIRAILLNQKNKKLDPRAELFLYLADRCQHVSEKIQPALAKDQWVMSDRFWDATAGYQGVARGLNGQFLEKLRPWVLGSLWPDKTFLLDCPVSIGLSRAWERINRSEEAQKESRFEKEAKSFHEEIRRGYLSLARKERERITVIDAAFSPDQIHQQIMGVLFP